MKLLIACVVMALCHTVRGWLFDDLNDSLNEYSCGTIGSPYDFDFQCYYRGTIAVTKSGITCQNWSDRMDILEGDVAAGLGYHNYCRNPDEGERAWCYTETVAESTGERWEYCDVPECDSTCGSVDEKQADYRGTIHKTNSGKTCQKWTEQSPHTHEMTPENKPDSGLAGHNNCRNPDGGDKAWCYTTDPDTRWEYCNVDNC